MLLLALAMLPGCASQVAAKRQRAPERAARFADGAAARPAAVLAAESVALADPDNEDATSDRSVVYEADYQILVPSAREAGARFLEHAKTLGGRLSSRSLSRVEVRVPAARFQALLEFLPGLGRVVAESVRATDVTDTVTDLRLRLQTARTSHTRLLSLLDKTSNVEEILAVEKEIRRLIGEIEQLEGQLKNLSEQVAYSRVAVAFRNLKNTTSGSPAARGPSRFWWINRVGVESFDD